MNEVARSKRDPVYIHCSLLGLESKSDSEAGSADTG